MTVQLELCRGARTSEYADSAARLRIEVFREFPYLYDGDLEYEREYLARYASSPGSVFVLAVDAGEVVGVSTGLPLRDADAAFAAPLVKAGEDPAKVFYLGESVLARSHRGLGLGHAFFEGREAAAREVGARTTAFCAVDRNHDHPSRPRDYRPLDAFWARRGYTRRPELVAALPWRQVDAQAEVPNTLTFWTRRLP